MNTKILKTIAGRPGQSVLRVIPTIMILCLVFVVALAGAPRIALADPSPTSATIASDSPDYPPGATVPLIGAPLVLDFKQCAQNETSGPVTGLGNCHWVGSILQSSNSKYIEGMSVPQRTIFTNIKATSGDVHTLRFSHENTKGGIHAYDFLTSYKQAQDTSLAVGGFALSLNECGQEIGPPAGLGVTCAALHDGFTKVVEIPDDPFTSKDGSTQTRIDAFEGLYGNRTIKIYGNSDIAAASLTLSHSVGSGGDTGDSDINYILTWTSASTEILIEMAGHLAVSVDGTPLSWGPRLGSGAIPGGPYHFKLRMLDEGAIGQQDNQIRSGDIISPARKEGMKFGDLDTGIQRY